MFTTKGRRDALSAELLAGEVSKKLQEALWAVYHAVALETPFLAEQMHEVVIAKEAGIPLSRRAKQAARDIEEWLDTNAAQNPKAAICVLVRLLAAEVLTTAAAISFFKVKDS